MEDMTLVDRTTFCVSAPDGSIGGGPRGFYVDDVRLLSEWRRHVGGAPLESLGSTLLDGCAARFVDRPPSGPAQHRDGPVTVLTTRTVSAGTLRESVTVRNHGTEPVSLRLEYVAAADFADVFVVRGAGAEAGARFGPDLRAERDGRSVRIAADGAESTSDGFVLAVDAGPGQAVTREIVVGDGPIAESAERARSWAAELPRWRCTDRRLQRALDRSGTDLGALRIPDGVEEVIAAGAPWYMTLFGRDSLLTAWMALPVAPALAAGTLRALAARQGVRHDPPSEEQPGKILHEVRDPAFFASFGDAFTGVGTYYGTADATALFVMLAGELYRWGHPDAVRPLLPALDRALAWIESFDRFVTYDGYPGGLVNQGWKDSTDSISHADGTLAAGPTALAEVQAYGYAAYRARAAIAAAEGDGRATEWEKAADELAARFREAYWVADGGYPALALDGAGRRCEVVSSNIGHVLWSGVLAPDDARSAADALTGAAMSSGFGLRTLSSEAARYNPVSYHNGSVWPHDTAIAIAGLARYGFDAEAGRLAADLLDAAEHFDGRLPELYCGFDRSEVPAPITYPSTCSPQAWAAAAPLLVARSLLGLEPGVSTVEGTAGPLGEVVVTGLR